jgi:FG-GAP-like repeat
LVAAVCSGSGQRYERVVSTAVGHPEWIELGPSSIAPSDRYNQSGAIESVLADPSNPARVFIGSVNGGIWRTNNATDLTPLWTSSTDHAPSLSIADLRFDPTDPTRNTIFAAIGTYSSLRAGGPLIGLLRSRNGGTSWASLAQSTLGGLQIRNVLPTTTLDPGQVVLVGADKGIYRSTNGGTTFTHLGATEGLPSGDTNASSLVTDPNAAKTFYAAIPGQGIFRTIDAGAHWNDVTNNIPRSGAGGITSASNLRLSISAAAPSPIYVAISTEPIAGLYRSTNQGASWTSLAVPNPPLNVNNLMFAFAADSGNANVVYAAGYQEVNNLQMGQILNGEMTWTSCTKPGDGPHGDSRNIQFDSNGDLLLGDDGGIWRLYNPSDSVKRHWRGINGSLGITEVNSAAYDTLNAIAFSGHQDTGTAQQGTEEAPFWDLVSLGDGTEQGVDNSASDRSIRFYSTGGNLAGSLSRTTYGSANQVLEANRHVMLADPSTPGVSNSGLLPNKGYGGFILNKVTPSRMILFGGALYEGVVNLNGSGDHADTIRTLPLPDAVNIIDNVNTTAAYGGWSGGKPNPGVIYVGFHVQELVGGQPQDFQRLYLRSNDAAALVKLPFPDAVLRGVAIDPNEWRVVYALGDSHVYKSPDAGQHWTDITRNLPLSKVRAVEVVDRGASPGGETVLVGGDYGVYLSASGGTSPWTRLGTNLPSVIVNDMHYYPPAARGARSVGDVLVIGTAGRGVWMWEWNGWRTNLSAGTSFQVHNWRGAWGSDGPMIAGDFNGDGKTDVMMWRDSTKSWTVNLSNGQGFNANEWKGAWGSDGPMITGDFNGDGKTDVMMWRDSTKSWTVNLSNGHGFGMFEWKGAWGSDGPMITGDFNGDGKTDVMMWRK